MQIDKALALAHWLRVREPADTAARSEALTKAIAERAPSAAPLRVLDLGTGTGSNIRYLAPRLRGSQHWLAVDRSAVLLARARGTDIDAEVETREADLGSLDDHRLFAGRHLVTASALLDLVSESWLRALAAHCRAERALALFALTYNGRSSCPPSDPGDEEVRELMNQHQKRDKGLGGAAAGPDGALVAEQCFLREGYSVRREPSDWVLEPADLDIQQLLIDGWAEAATEMEPDRAQAIRRWHARRIGHLEAGRSRIVVGHDDVAAWPPGVEPGR
jgi:SAM-dependent methyltransferase